MIELGVRKAETIRQVPLEIGYQLQRYQIERVLGENSFSLTYLARDLNLDRLVAIREYLPSNIAVREGPVFVHPLRDDLDERYHSGLELFLAEARALAKIDHPNIVRVLNVFVNHNTAYMVMLYEDAEKLTDVLKQRRTLNESELTAVLLPILDGLERVHRSGYLHRDINPSNILIRSDNAPVLIDFGSARLGMGETTSDSLSSPCTALEQYYEKADQQGPWTDIYGLAATAYYALSGTSPADALQRSQAVLHGARDPLVPAAQVAGGGYSPGFLRAIDHALNLNPVKRPQTIAVWRRSLGGVPISQATPAVPMSGLDGPTISPDLKLEEPTLQGHFEPREIEKEKPSRWAMVVPLLLGVGLGLAGLAYYAQQDEADDSGTDQQSAAQDNTPERDNKASLDKDSMQQPGSDLAQQSQEPPDTSAQVQPSTVPQAPPPAPEAKVSDRVNELLLEARSALEAGKLVEPATDNALDKYRAILALQPGQVDAEIGVEAIAKTLLEQARTSIGQARFEEAGQLIEKASLVRPGLADLDTVRNELVAQRQELEKREEQRREDDALRNKRDQVVDRLVEDARKAMRRLQWSKADEILNKAAELAPAAEDVKDLRAQIAARQAQVDLERNAATPQATPAPKDDARAAVYIAAARRAIANKQWRRAEIDLNKAAELAPASDEIAALQFDLAQARLTTVEPTAAPAIEQTKPSEPAVATVEGEPKPVESTTAESTPETRVEIREPVDTEYDTREPSIEDQVANVRPGRRTPRTMQKEAPDRVAAAAPGSTITEQEPVPNGSPASDLATVTIRQASANFDIVSPGETIQFSTEYTVTLPPDTQREWVEIQWILKRDGRKLGQEGSDSRKVGAGNNVATNEFTLPSYMKPGRYMVEHRVRLAGHTATARTYFTVTASGQ